MERLLRLRLAVARFGEMDGARWWNTNGQLGKLGAMALRRGFPRTHRFAQARAVFAVAGHRCREVLEPPQCVTLWDLRLPSRGVRGWCWLEQAEEWKRSSGPRSRSADGPSSGLDLVTDVDLEALARLRRSADGRAVQLPGVFTGTDSDFTLLALGFARGEPGALAVPYMRKADA
jgi:hypothetical protein